MSPVGAGAVDDDRRAVRGRTFADAGPGEQTADHRRNDAAAVLNPQAGATRVADGQTVQHLQSRVDVVVGVAGRAGVERAAHQDGLGKGDAYAEQRGVGRAPSTKTFSLIM